MEMLTKEVFFCGLTCFNVSSSTKRCGRDTSQIRKEWQYFGFKIFEVKKEPHLSYLRGLQTCVTLNKIWIYI